MAENCIIVDKQLLEYLTQCSYIEGTERLERIFIMAADSVIRARIDSDVKAEATAALKAMGLSPSDAIRMLMIRIANEQRLPFAVDVSGKQDHKEREA